MVVYYEKGWITDDGVMNYRLSIDCNIAPFINDDTWLKSQEGISKVLAVLERRFCMYGYDDMLSLADGDHWLFYVAYRLSLFLDDCHRSARYLRALLVMYPHKEDVLSKQMLLYLELRTSGLSHEEGIKKIEASEGAKHADVIRKAIREHDLKYARLLNPFRFEQSKKSTSRRTLRLIETFFQKRSHGDPLSRR
jgi:hypothetical protein